MTETLALHTDDLANLEFISVIVPVHNSEKWLRRCLSSIAEACDANCEVVVVDDGSTDSSLTIAREFEDEDPRFIVVEQTNHGVAEARRYGLESSSGDSVIFFDSDDVMPLHAINDLRRVSTADSDIVVGNISWIDAQGKKTLSVTGEARTISGTEYAHCVMTGANDFYIIGKKFRRSLFDDCFWDTNPVYAGLFQRALLLALACKAGNVVIAPSAHTYIHVARPWSLSALIQLRPEGIERLWQTVTTLPLPKDDLAIWGLDLLYATLLNRGIPFESDLPVAAEIRALCRNMHLSDHHKKVLELISSKRKRTTWSRNNLREGLLTVAAPHMSFVVIAHNGVKRVHRTLNSIFNTGFRNIEIILVDDGSNTTASIEFNSMSVLYPRIKLIKNQERKGAHTARKQALAAVTGLAVMFVDPGDTVVPVGILEALNLIDTGADIAFMGTSYSSWTGLFGQDFDPTVNVPVHDVHRTTFDNFAAIGSATRAVHGAIIRTDHMIKSHMAGDDLEIKIDFKTLMLLEVLTEKAKVAATAIVGYRRMARNSGGSPLDLCRRQLCLGLDNVGSFRNKHMATGGRFNALSYGITVSLTHALSRILVNPITGKRKARKAVSAIMAMPEYTQFYSAVGSPQPTAETLLSRAADYLDVHRARITSGAITGY